MADKKLTEKEMETMEWKIRLENEDKKEDAQRKMAWFSLSGMILYPFAAVLSTVFGLDQATKVLGDMAATYFVSVAGIVAAFFGSQAYSKGK